MSRQNIFILSFAGIILILSIIIIWWVFSSESEVLNPGQLSPGLPEQEIVLPSALPQATLLPEQRQQLKLIATGDITSFWSVATTTVQYFKEGSGLWEAEYFNPQVQESKIELGVNLKNVLSVYPSSLSKILIEYAPEGNNQSLFSVLDLETNDLKNLDQNIWATSWSPKGDELLFYYSDSPLYYQEEETPESRYLGIMNDDLSGEETIFNLKMARDLILSWIATDKIYITQKPSGLINQTSLVYDFKTRTFENFLTGNGLILKWDKLGNYGLLFFTQKEGISPSLKLINKDAVSLGTFPDITLPEKCVFSNSEPILYCAISSDIPLAAVWPDDYYQGAFNLSEAIYKINLQTFEAEPLIEQSVFEIRGIDLSPDDAHLLFYDLRSKGLYSLNVE